MSSDYISRKERWARKRASGIRRSSPRSPDSRLPPGQRLVENFPVLDLGLHPQIPLDHWHLRIHGEVESPAALDWDAYMKLPQMKTVSDFHCVTTWSKLDMAWEGVRFLEICDLVRPTADVRCIFFKAYDGYTSNNPIETCMDEDVLIAHRWNGSPLTKEHGAPARVIIPKRYAWKGVKFLKEIIFLKEDALGFWERRGYSNTADPWSDDRFSPVLL